MRFERQSLLLEFLQFNGRYKLQGLPERGGVRLSAGELSERDTNE